LHNLTVWLVVLHQLIIIALLYQKEDNFHEVEETQILFGFIVSLKHEIHDCFNLASVAEVLDVLKMSKYLHELVPDGICEVGRLILAIFYLINPQQLQRHFLINLFQILGN